MAESLTKDVALALLGNTLPTGAILVVLITILGPISGAHFNPAVSLVFALKRDLAWRETALYVGAQLAGGVLGTLVAHGMFALPLFDASLKARTGSSAMVCRGGRGIWACRNHPSWHPVRTRLRALARRPLHNRCVLVYGLDFIRQSGRCDRTLPDQHVRRYSTD